jgi:hypothetical protein
MGQPVGRPHAPRPVLAAGRPPAWADHGDRWRRACCLVIDRSDRSDRPGQGGGRCGQVRAPSATPHSCARALAIDGGLQRQIEAGRCARPARNLLAPSVRDVRNGFGNPNLHLKASVWRTCKFLSSRAPIKRGGEPAQVWPNLTENCFSQHYLCSL